MTEVIDPPPELLEQVFRLRVEAWKARVSAFPDIEQWRDAFDDAARHFVAMCEGAPIAAARLTIHDKLEDTPDAGAWRDLAGAVFPAPVGVITRLTVHPTGAGLNLSRLLDEVRIAAATDAGCRCIVATTTAGPYRIAQLENAGFRLVGTGVRAPGVLGALPPPACMMLDLRPPPTLTSAPSKPT